MPGLSGLIGDLAFGINPTDVSGVTSLGHNLVGFAFPNDGFPIGLPNANGDYVGDSNAPLDPLVDQLDDNGGLTETMALLPGSLALDHGTSAGAPAADQRGVARPQGAGFDIGAFESEQVPPLDIVTGANLPAGAVNQLYSAPIVAANGTPPYNFTLTGGPLPNGVTFSNTGLLSGTPTESGNFSFTAVVEDADLSTAQKTFYLTIAPPPLTIVTSVLPPGNQNQSYAVQLVADGGVTPYVFSQSGGALPDGIVLNSSGLLSGTPTEFGLFNFDVTVTDNAGTTAPKNLFLTIYPALAIRTDANLPTGIVNQFYSRQITADGGVGPYGFSVAGGALPNGFSLSAGGVVSGTAAQAGAFSIVVEASDAQGITVQKTFRLTISDLYVVTTAADTNDGVCDAQCSLREAVAAGDSVPGASNMIEFSAFFDNPVRIYLNSPIVVNKTTEIRGKGRNKTRIASANPVSNTGAKFRIPGTADAVFRDLQMDDGGFFTGTRSIEHESSGRLTIENCIFKGSYVTDADGGAILQTAGTLVVDDSTFTENVIVFSDFNCARKGAAIAVLNAAAQITNSTFSNNSSPTASAIYGSGAMTIENSTIAYNSSPTTAPCPSSPSATILNESGSGAIVNSTVFENAVNSAAGSALIGGMTVKNSIIARNFRLGGGPITSPNIGPGVVSLGHNLIGFAPALTAGLPNANGDYVGTAAAPLDPLLSPLAPNGGENQTLEPQGASLAIDHGAAAGAPPSDQRGVARPQGAGVDVGAFETDVPVTSAPSPAGSNVIVPLGAVAVTFANVTDAGTTTQVPIYPAISGTLPGGFSFGAGLPAFQITTTANYTGPILVCIQTPNVDAQTFNSLRLLHNENGALVDRTFSRDSATRKICAQTTSLSPFAVAQTLAPTAATAVIAGRVTAENGRLAGARVVLTEASGNVRTAVSNSFGYYRLTDVPAGQTVVLEVRAKGFRFGPRALILNADLADVDFTALP